MLSFLLNSNKIRSVTNTVPSFVFLLFGSCLCDRLKWFLLERYAKVVPTVLNTMANKHTSNFISQMLSREESNTTEFIHLRQEEEEEEAGGRRRDEDEDEDEDEDTQVVIFLAAAAARTVDVARHAFGRAAKRNHGRAAASE